MRLVVDANILFAIIIKRSFSLELFVNEKLELFAPEYLFVELDNHKDLLLNKSGFTNEDYINFVSVLKARITILPEKNYNTFIDYVTSICPDKEDIIYFALALSLNAPLWSNDKILKTQDIVKVISTQELLDIIKD